MSFKKAHKFESKLRLALAGPAGSGKTYTALTLATALADGKEIALIDTERGSASKYADLFSFDVMELDSYHPDKFVQGIHEAEQAGYAVLVIDSLSHAWNGTGGLLEIVEAITKRSNSKNSFNAWGEATPIQNRLIEAITRAKLHIIATMRSKTEYVVEMGSNGKTAPRKVGTAPIQRDGFEYEFDVFCDLDIDNTLIVQKSRCPALSSAVIAKPDAKVAEMLKVWLGGEQAPMLAVPASTNGHDADKPVLYNGDGTPAMPAQDGPSDTLKQLLTKCKQRAFAVGIKTRSQWEEFRKQYAHAESDEQVTISGVGAMNGELTIREKAAKSA